MLKFLLAFFLFAGTLNAQITVVHSAYGSNVQMPGLDDTARLTVVCNGKTSCSYLVLLSVIGDPFSGLAKNYVATYRCGVSPTILSATALPGLPVDAGLPGSTITLSCPVIPTPTPTLQPTPGGVPCVVVGSSAGWPPVLRIVTSSLPLIVGSNGLLDWPDGTPAVFLMELTPGIVTKFNVKVTQ
jgi:hypothetical protein